MLSKIQKYESILLTKKLFKENSGLLIMLKKYGILQKSNSLFPLIYAEETDCMYVLHEYY